MTADLYDQAPEDVEDIVIAWLKPSVQAPNALGLERPDTDPPILPFRMVTGITGVDDCNQFDSESIVSVHTFDKTRVLAKRAARDTHRRMLVLASDPLTDIVMVDGRIANIEYLDVVERPTYRDYKADNVKRYVARYRIGLEFVSTT